MEVELAKLNREYGLQRANYRTLVMRRETALVADRLEQAGEAKLDILKRLAFRCTRFLQGVSCSIRWYWS
jgi:hypothetical protein